MCVYVCVYRIMDLSFIIIIIIFLFYCFKGCSVFDFSSYVVVFVCQVLSIFEALLKSRGLNTFVSLMKSLVLYSM